MSNIAKLHAELNLYVLSQGSRPRNTLPDHFYDLHRWQ